MEISGELSDSGEASVGFHQVAAFNFTDTSNRSSADDFQFVHFNQTLRVSVEDGSAVLKMIISVIYSVICVLGLIGNFLVLYLMNCKKAWKKSGHLFVSSYAVAGFQFALTLPFWAVENALENWLFGNIMCKIVRYVTCMSMYASVFFLTAMCVAHYWSLVKSKQQCPRWCCSTRSMTVGIWIAAISAALPQAVFSKTVTVSNDVFCTVTFPGSLTFSQLGLGLYHTQKVLIGFLIPLVIISVCYLLLLRFTTSNDVNMSSTKTRPKVTKSVTMVVLSYFLCWLPNRALTTWGILVKFNVVLFSYEYYIVQLYISPMSICLAMFHSCLNPILYCLLHREFRKALRKLFQVTTSPSVTNMKPLTASTKPEEAQVLVVPGSESAFCSPGVVM